MNRRELITAGGAGLAVGAVGVPTGAGCTAGATSSTADPGFEPRARTLPPDFVRGMNFAHLHSRGWGYGSDRAKAQADRLYTLGVRNMALNPFAYTRSLSSPDISWGGDPTMTDDDIRAEVANLRTRGFDVLMKPHLWANSFWGGAKGNGDITLDAAGWTHWFSAYTRFAVHYAALAAESGCTHLCVGLEYTSATRENPGAWAKVAAACRDVFPGKLLYAANWHEEYEIFADWAAFDLVGINAYFPLKTQTVEEMVAEWTPTLDRIEKVAAGKPVVFPEAGYRAVARGTEQPWDPGDGPFDPAVQARGYEALLRACSARPWFAGIWWWKWFTDLPGERDLYVPADMPAERVMKAWFTA